MQPAELTVHARNLAFWHGDRRLGFGLDLPAVDLTAGAELVAVFGANGCGKTTLLRLLAGAMTPSLGSVIWRRDSGEPFHPRVGRDVVLTNAAGPFPHLTVQANLELPLRRAGMPVGAALAAAEQWGLAALAARMPHELSAGQSQRVVLARALALDARAYLFDEVASAQSEDWAAKIGRELRRIVAAGHLVIVISHDVAWVARYADRVIALAADEVPDGQAAVYTPSTVRYDGPVAGWPRLQTWTGAAG